MTRRTVAALLVSFTVAACGGTRPDTGAGSSANNQAGPAGTYALVSIDGHAVPYAPVDRDRPPEAPPAPEIVSATLVIEPGGTFRQKMTFRMQQGLETRTVERDFTGTWVGDGDGYRLDWEGAGATPARLSGDMFTYDNVGMLLAFRRQRP